MRLPEREGAVLISFRFRYFGGCLSDNLFCLELERYAHLVGARVGVEVAGGLTGVDVVVGKFVALHTRRLSTAINHIARAEEDIHSDPEHQPRMRVFVGELRVELRTVDAFAEFVEMERLREREVDCKGVTQTLLRKESVALLGRNSHH